MAWSLQWYILFFLQTVRIFVSQQQQRQREAKREAQERQQKELVRLCLKCLVTSTVQLSALFLLCPPLHDQVVTFILFQMKNTIVHKLISSSYSVFMMFFMSPFVTVLTRFTSNKIYYLIFFCSNKICLNSSIPKVVNIIIDLKFILKYLFKVMFQRQACQHFFFCQHFSPTCSRNYCVIWIMRCRLCVI